MEPIDREELYGDDEPKVNKSYSLLHAWLYGQITDEQYDQYKKEPSYELSSKKGNTHAV